MATRTPPKPPPLKKPEPKAPEQAPEQGNHDETTAQEDLREALSAISDWTKIAENALDEIAGEESKEPEEE